MENVVMKWPRKLTLIRHAESKYNILKKQKEGSELYTAYLAAYAVDFQSPQALELAKEVRAMFRLPSGDWNTGVTPDGLEQAYQTGLGLKEINEVPDVVFISPYHRTQQTWQQMVKAFPALADPKIKVFQEERLREQEHGLGLIYNDKKVFFTHYPDQKELYALEGSYRYRWPQGESVPDVRDRVGLWVRTIIREFSGCSVWVISHHLTILSVMASLERWDADEFMRVDREEKPINCGVSVYESDPKQGRNGRLVRAAYNQRLTGSL
jgi:broad specificity phosphatase PhoE